MLLIAKVERPNGAITRHRLLNISDTGAALVDPQGLTVGTQLRLSVGALASVAGVVVRVTPDRMGIRFQEAVDADVVRKQRIPQSTAGAEAGWLGNMRDRYRR